MSAVEVHAVEDGPADAPVVLMAGSLGSSLEMWDPQMRALSARLRVVRYDARGHGRSPVPPGPYVLDDLVDDAVALLDRLEVERAHVVGLSLGGMTAMRLAAREPDRVDRLALLCTSAWFASPELWAERRRTVRAQGTAAIADAVVARWFTHHLRQESPALVQRMRDMVASTPAEGYASCCSAIESMDLRNDLGRIAAPVLVIAGAVPGARLVVLPRAAHLANVEQAEAVDAALLAHLDPAGTTT